MFLSPEWECLGAPWYIDDIESAGTAAQKNFLDVG